MHTLAHTSLKAQQHALRFAALCGKGPELLCRVLPHSPLRSAFRRVSWKSPKYRLTFPSHDGLPLPTWPHWKGTFLSLSLSFPHTQTVFQFSLKICLYDAKIKTDRIPLEWKIYDCLAAVSEHYTHSESIKEVVSFLLVFHEKLEVFENLKQKTHVSLFIVCTEPRLRGKEREGEALSIIFDISQKSCFPPLLLNKPAKICMELINGSRCGAFKSVSFE